MSSNVSSMRKEHLLLFGVMATLTLATLCLIILHYPDLPDRIPTHFNTAGNPDAWGSKTSILLFPGLEILFLVLSMVIYRYPNYANIPSTIALSQLPDGVRKKAYSLIRSVILITMSLVSFLMFYLTRENLLVARGLEKSINNLPIWITIGCLAPVIVYYAIKMRRLE